MRPCSLDLPPTPAGMCENCAIMVKKYDPNHKYGNPSPTILARNERGQFVKLPGSLTKQKQYDRKRRIAVAYRFTRQEHSFIKNVAYKIGVSLQAFCASASILHAQKIAQELAAQNDGEIIE